MNRIRDWVNSNGGYIAIKDYSNDFLTPVALNRPKKVNKTSRNTNTIKGLRTVEVKEDSMIISEKIESVKSAIVGSEISEEAKEEQPIINEPEPQVQASKFKGFQDTNSQLKSLITKPINSSRTINLNKEDAKQISTRPIFPAKTIIAKPINNMQRQKTVIPGNQLKGNILGKPDTMLKPKAQQIAGISKVVDDEFVLSAYVDAISRRNVAKEEGTSEDNKKPVNALQRAYTQKMASNVLARPPPSKVIAKPTKDQLAVPYSVRPQVNNPIVK